MENINQKKHQRDDLDKKESTSSGENDDVPSTSSKPKEFIHDDVCSICMDDVSMLDIKTYVTYTCCGKVMHKKCAKQLYDTDSLSDETSS